MANTNRAEVLVRLPAGDFLLRPTFQAICSIEGELGIGMSKLITKIAGRDVWMRDLAVVFHHTAVAGGRADLTFEQAGDLVMEHYREISEKVVDLLAGIFGKKPADSSASTAAAAPAEVKTEGTA